MVPRLHTGRGVNRAPEFFAPVPLLSVAVLALNDHVLKARFHNALTGKLSDLAGCFVLPLFVSALLAMISAWPLRTRLQLGAAATVALFVPIKLSDTAAQTVARVLASTGAGPMHIVVDPTDLVAVPMVALAVWCALRRTTHAAMA